MRLAIVGTGLIGASAGLAAHRAGFASVAGWDEDTGVLEVAAERGAVTPAASLEAALHEAELVFVAVPVAAVPAVVHEVLALAPDDSTVTDAGSTKASVCRAAGDDPRFVGGHPICGAEARGRRARAPTCSRARPGSSRPSPRRSRPGTARRTPSRPRSGRDRWRSIPGRTTGSSR